MFATAQSKYLHIYDNQGIELHCMRDHNEPVKLDYLPYHFLLVSGSKLGTLRWLDVSMGQTAAEARTKKGEMLCMTQNRMNGVMALGHSNGEVTMWTPNMGNTPVVKLLAHPSAPVSDLAISRNGTYMATVGKDSRLKIWDIRSTYKCLYDYFTPAPASSVDFSDKGLVACAFGNEVQVWKNSATEKQKMPYMKHKVASGSQVTDLKFCPYEDVLSVGHAQGYSSLVIPGSGEANFDAYEANPFETKRQT